MKESEPVTAGGGRRPRRRLRRLNPELDRIMGRVGISASGHTTTLKGKKVSLPKGLKLSSSGVLSGTPTAKLPAPTSITVEVTETVMTLNGTKRVKTKTSAHGTLSFG